ncbi:Mor transcription activator family protein [Pontibacterium granulatum]|uniref:Mor transcription activator family protein n=1 Tax=Pontibacterium granulatum TaxID=2036029 RepID=UPI00249AE0CA|nr:Mor transcription activator family protein [Pontibacterium granulatum]MDI3325596.1 Mor transcription activator family protein [Pontibacterium granulatum]
MAEEQKDWLGDSSFTDELLNHLDEIPDDVRKKWPKDLAALIDLYQASMQRMGYEEKEAKKIAHTLLAEQAIYCGGRHVYIPKGDRFKQAVRDIELFNDWHDRGIVPDELATRYKLSTQHVYRIIKEQRTIHMKRVQPSLL